MSVLQTAMVGLVGGLLLLAACVDLRSRIIPDTVSVLIALAAVVARPDLSLLRSAGIACVVFLVFAAFCRRGWIGGGDVKLLTALALFIPPTGVFPMLLAVAVFGGVLSVPYAAGRALHRTVRPARPASDVFTRWVKIEAWRLSRGGPLPYGVAIAGGGLLTLVTR